MVIHFIAIGGAVMHNLAIALHRKGDTVTGSDDEIFEPSKGRLEKYGLLPRSTGWFPEQINSDIDIIILGMHAREDNPELIRARQLNLKIKSFPEFLYEQTKNKKRIVIGGSHGKTTITSMIMHVLTTCNIKFDYMVGSIIDGFETMVGLNDDTCLAIFEGDEYLTSTLDRRPKFHLYHPHIAVISGIAWDHINVFPDYNNYVEQFRIFIGMIEPEGILIYNEEDSEVNALSSTARHDISKRPYNVLPYSLNPGGFKIVANDIEYSLKVFGIHNMQNISAAKEVCLSVGIEEESFYRGISTFSGSAKRLQLIRECGNSALYLDFAHAPSKVKATVEAIKQRYPDYLKVCCFELHTYSSLSAGFLNQYKDCLAGSDKGYVYFNPHAIEQKRLDPLSVKDVGNCFGRGVSGVFDDSDTLFAEVSKIKSDRVVYLFMSSGDFNGININEVALSLIPDSKI